MYRDLSTIRIGFFEYGYTLLDKKWRGQTFNEDYARLYHITDGNAEIWHSDRYFFMKPGETFLIPPNANMRFRCREYCRIIWLHFDLQIGGNMDLFYPGLCIFSRNAETTDVKSMMEELINLLNKDNDRSTVLRRQGIFLQIISEFFIGKPAKKSHNETVLMEKFEPVINYIRLNCDKKITLNELARTAGYEKTYFSALFKKHFSISPLRYVLNARIEKAKNMLSDPNEKLSSVATACGFTDSFHLSKTFKKINGVCPRDFRKNLFSKKP